MSRYNCVLVPFSSFVGCPRRMNLLVYPSMPVCPSSYSRMIRDLPTCFAGLLCWMALFAWLSPILGGGVAQSPLAGTFSHGLLLFIFSGNDMYNRVPE